jgi:hypothetical protein
MRRLAGAPLIAAGFAALGAFVVWHARSMPYETPVGPGPGFFPTWLGLLLCVLSLGALAEALGGGDAPSVQPDWRAIAPILAAVAAFALAIEPAGFVITVFGVLLFLLRAHGCRLVPTGLAVAIAGSLGLGYAFNQWLGVFLPPAPFGLLAPIGL